MKANKKYGSHYGSYPTGLEALRATVLNLAAHPDPQIKELAMCLDNIANHIEREAEVKKINKEETDRQLRTGYAALAADPDYQAEQERKLELRRKWKAVHEFEERHGLDIREFIAELDTVREPSIVEKILRINTTFAEFEKAQAALNEQPKPANNVFSCDDYFIANQGHLTLADGTTYNLSADNLFAVLPKLKKEEIK